ncbi:MAG: VCBS repeat-containing protein [Acidobacteriota bacterium]|nr:VCBS repeat-containing protein [Acidobacteriota bacterium]
MRFLIILVLSAGFFLAVDADTSSGPIEFRTHVIESNMPGGYSVIIADVNNDKQPDVIGMTSQLTELAWYENPGWERHVMIKDMKGMVNLAAYDVDGDGIPELAIQNEFSMVASKSPGLVWLLQHQGDPKGLWKASKIDQVITSHHVAWADIDGDGKKELINAPLIGPKGLAPRFDQDNVSLFYYRTPSDLQGEWARRLIDDKLKGVLHRARVVQWNSGPREQILTAGFDGIVLHEAAGKGDAIQWKHTVLSKGHEEEAPRAGTSDVKMGRLHANRIMAAVEPWHGNEVVVYTQDKSGAWQRKVIFSELKEGHEVCVGDFNGDGRDDIVAGDRAKGQISSSHIFYAQDDQGRQWHHEILDPMGMSASGCQVADINHDGRPDIVMIGGATHNIKWYENLGTKLSARQ